MSEHVRKFDRLFRHINYLQDQIAQSENRTLFEKYLRDLTDIRLKERKLNDNQIMEKSFDDLYRKCCLIQSGQEIEVNTPFIRMLRAYITTHPLSYGQQTRSWIYCWIFFSFYYDEKLHERNTSSLQDVTYGQGYRTLCELVGQRDMIHLVNLIDDAFGLNRTSDIKPRSTYDYLSDLLKSQVSEVGCQLWELLLDHPDLIDYEWIKFYRRHEHRKANNKKE